MSEVFYSRWLDARKGDSRFLSVLWDGDDMTYEFIRRLVNPVNYTAMLRDGDFIKIMTVASDVITKVNKGVFFVQIASDEFMLVTEKDYQELFVRV